MYNSDYSQAGFFDNNQSQGGTPQQQETRETSLRPLTVRQILNAEISPSGDFLLVDHKPIRQVRFIGVIRGISTSGATGKRYRIEDGTGTVEARTFNTPGDDEVDMQAAPEEDFAADTYVSVLARVTASNDRRTVTIHEMRRITDFNEVAYHLLNTIHSHVRNTGGLTGATADNNEESSLFVGNNNHSAGYGMGASGGNSVQSEILKYLSKFEHMDSGIHVQQIASDLGKDVNVVKQNLESLNSVGNVYVPEDDHYAITPQ